MVGLILYFLGIVGTLGKIFSLDFRFGLILVFIYISFFSFSGWIIMKMLVFSHGLYQRRCKCCVIREQLKHAKKMAKKIEKLEVKLKKIKCV